MPRRKLRNRDRKESHKASHVPEVQVNDDLLTLPDLPFEQKMKEAEEIIKRYRNTLRALAK